MPIPFRGSLRRVVARFAAVSTIATTLVAGGVVPTPGAETTTEFRAGAEDVVAERTGPLAAFHDGLVSEPSVEPFEAIGASWVSGAVSFGDVEIRLRSDDRWGPWLSLDAEDEHSPDAELSEGEIAESRLVSDPVLIGGDGYELRVPPSVRDVQVHPVRVHETTVVDIGRDEAEAAEAVRAAGALNGPPMKTRGHWGARAKRVPAASECRPLGHLDGPSCVADDGIDLAIIHHTVNTNSYSQASVPSMLRSIQAYHMDARGWDDIAYNFLVDRFGTIWEARAGGVHKPVIGGHAKGFNSVSVGIAVLGDFSSVSPSSAAVTATGKIAGWKLNLDGIDPKASTLISHDSLGNENVDTPVTLRTVSGHRDTRSTGCPGRLYEHLGSIRNAAAALYPSQPGHIDRARQRPTGGFEIAGWAKRSGSSSPASLQVWVDREYVKTIVADHPRSDVGPHGFATVVSDVGAGNQRVCVYVLGSGGGYVGTADCALARIQHNPFGAFDRLKQRPGSVFASGWMIDPDTTASLPVHIYVDGKLVKGTHAGTRRPGVGTRYGYGANHGFSTTFALPSSGSHKVCIYGINHGPGRNTRIGCKQITIRHSPIGGVSGIMPAPGGLYVSGWAIDPDTSASIPVHIYRNGALVKGVSASRLRPDVDKAHPGYGARHGYETAIPAGNGKHRICVYGIDAGPGSNRRIGCRTHTRTGNPFGVVDAVRRPTPGTIEVQGWAIDPDTTGPVTIDVTRNGAPVASLVADKTRSGVGRAYPPYGADHGYRETLVAQGGRICVIARNIGSGSRRTLGCRTV